MPRRFPAPWTVEKIPGGFKVLDANGQALAYCNSRETERDAQIAKVLTEDEAKAHSGEYRQATDAVRRAEELELDFPEGGG